METYGSLSPTGWSTGVVTNIFQDNIVDGEDAEGCLGGVSGGDHPGHHLHPPTRVHQAGVRDVPGDTGCSLDLVRAAWSLPEDI